MTRQTPKPISAEEAARMVREPTVATSSGAVADAPRIRREVVMPGESKRAARKRWEREREIEEDMRAEGRRTGGRVLPVKGAE